MAIQYRYLGLNPVQFISKIDAQKCVKTGDIVLIDESELPQFLNHKLWERVYADDKALESSHEPILEQNEIEEEHEEAEKEQISEDK